MAGSTIGKRAVVVGALVNASPFRESLEMLLVEEVGVRKVRARWMADIILDRGFGFVTVFLAEAMAGSKSDELLEIRFCYLIRLPRLSAVSSEGATPIRARK